MKYFFIVFFLTGCFFQMPEVSKLPETIDDTPDNTDTSGLPDTTPQFPAPKPDPTPQPEPPEITTPSGPENPYLNLACDAYVGQGRNNLEIKENDIPSSGNVLCINEGNYQNISIQAIQSDDDPIIIQNAGLVTINNSLELRNLKNVVLSGSGTQGIERGIVIQNTGYRGATFKGRNHSVTLQDLAFINVPDYVITWEVRGTIFDGSSTSSDFYNIKLLRLTSENSGEFLNAFGGGAWGGYAGKDFSLNLEVAYCHFKNSPDTASVLNLSGAYNVNIHHNIFENMSTNTNQHNGMIFIKGNGKIYNNYFRHTLGNSIRAWPSSLDFAGYENRLDIYNNISVDTIKYSMIEIQPFEDHQIDGVTKTTHIRIYHNTAGNLNHGVGLPNGPELWNAGLVDLYGSFGETVDIQNNLLFNVNKPQNNTYFINGQGYWPSDRKNISNNLYFNSYQDAGLIDPINVKPQANSPVVRQASKLDLASHDFNDRPRSNQVDIGAVEH